MDYFLIAKYKPDYKIPLKTNNVFVKMSECICKYQLTPCFPFTKLTLKKCRIYKYFGKSFYVYKNKIEIWEDKTLIEQYGSKSTVLVNNGIFMLKNDEGSFVLNEKMETTKVNYRDDMIYFLGSGLQCFVNNGFVLRDPSNSNKTRNFVGNLGTMDSKGKVVLYDSDSECIDLNEIQIFKGKAKIENIVDISHFYFDEKVILIVLTDSAVFMICEDIVIKKKVTGLFYIVPTRMVIHNFFTEETISDMLSYFNIYFPSKKLSKGAEKEIANFTFLVQTEDKQKYLVSWVNFMNNLKQHQDILCRAYRLIDEKGKREISKFIDFKLLNAHNLYLTIFYNLDYLELLVEKCINEQKIFLLKDLYDNLKGRGEERKLLYFLLKKNILFERVAGYEDVYEMQMMEVDSQRAINK